MYMLQLSMDEIMLEQTIRKEQPKLKTLKGYNDDFLKKTRMYKKIQASIMGEQMR